jgi:4-amino-4-deoxy-L-arabinose transferase-like glycosyltransferase
MTSDPPTVRRHLSLAPEWLPIAGGLLFALLGRGRWADVVADHGLDLSNVEGVLSGGRLLHEVRIQFGPVSVWLLAAICRIFGTTLSTLVAAQFLIGFGAVLAVQSYSRRFLSEAERWLCAAMLTTTVLWMAGPGNLLFPYRFAVSPGLLLALAALEAGARGVARRSIAAAALSGVLAGVAFATKQEMGAVAAVGIALLVLLDPGLELRVRAGLSTCAAAGGIGAYAGVFALCLHGDGFRNLARKNLLWPWANVPDSWQELYHRGQGLEHPGRLAVAAGESLVIAGACLGTFWLLLYGGEISRRRSLGLATAVAAAWGVWAWRWAEGAHFQPFTLCLPLLAAAGVLFFVRSRHDTERRAALGPFAAVLAGAFLLLSREGYRGGIEGYYSGLGYVLVIPAAVPVLVAVVQGPAAAAKRRWIAAAATGLVLALFGWARLHRLRGQWEVAAPIATARGTAYCDPKSAPFLRQASELLLARTGPGDSILMLPTTAGLDFLLDRRNESFFPNMFPGVIVGPDGEEELIRRWSSRPPRVIVQVRHSLGVFRRGEFGETWGDHAMRWIERHYEPITAPPEKGVGEVRYWRLAGS